MYEAVKVLTKGKKEHVWLNVQLRRWSDSLEHLPPALHTRRRETLVLGQFRILRASGERCFRESVSDSEGNRIGI
jgi:hypothetical protein